MQLTGALGLALVAASGACGASASSPPSDLHYQLSCDSADTQQTSRLYCVRLDTRNGDAQLVDLDKLPLTAGSSRAVDERDGTYQLACDATATAAKSDFFCLRLHRRTGEIVLLRLGELPRWPP